MKQIFYGPTGYGKSHLILHGLASKKNLIIINAATSVQREFEHVGLNNIPVTTIPISVEEVSGNKLPNISIDVKNICELKENCILGFDVGNVCHPLYEKPVIYKIVEWLETMGAASSYNHTIVFMNIFEIQDFSFLKKIENWNADIVIEYTIGTYAIKQGEELIAIKKSGQWFEIPILVDMCQK